MARELDLAVHLAAVERARRDDLPSLLREAEDVAGVTEPELGGDGRCEAHRIDGEPGEHHLRAPFGDHRLECGLVRVVLELVRIDLHADDLVDTVELDLRLEGRGIARDQRHRDGPAELARGGDELPGHVAHLSADVLRDDQHAHFSFSWTSSLIRCAADEGLPSSISAPAPFAGANIRRTR